MSKGMYDIIRRPLVTEKGNDLRDEQNKYVFQVARDANKLEIRAAVEKMFDVRVFTVRTSIVRGKVKRVGRHAGKRPNWKKAVVALHPTDTIEIFEGV